MRSVNQPSRASRETGSAKPITPVIVIGLVGSSMRSHALSGGDIGNERGAGSIGVGSGFRRAT